MNSTQRLPDKLTPLPAARDAWLSGLVPVAPGELRPADALRCIAADMPAMPGHPRHDVASVDGWALRAHDLIGASAYSPVPLPARPAWVEAGDRMPDACDCVLDADAVDATGPIVQALAEAAPGQGLRRAGSDIAAGDRFVDAGQRILARHLLLARAAGQPTITVRRPRLRIVNLPGGAATAAFAADQARDAGAEVSVIEPSARDAAAIAAALDASSCDLIATVGGTGVGRGDATIAAIGQCGEIIAHGIALQPGRTSAVGLIAGKPVVALPGAPDQAFAAWWTLVVPALDRLSGRQSRPTLRLPLARKIASTVGITEIALLQRRDDAWLPLATGELPLRMIARADAGLAISAGSEGFAVGAAADAYMLRE